MRARAFLFLLSSAALGTAAAQAPGTVARTGVFFESYSFGSGLAFDRLSEMTIPITVVQRLGNRVTVDVGTAYARASVGQTNGKTIEHSGFTDTDVRAAVAVVPGRLIFTVVGSLPTGASAVPDTTIPLFGATGTDLLGFTTPGFGSGGGLSAGFASAFRLGQNWAVGTGASYRYAASYTPVQDGDELAPGGEARLRVGMEGPFGGGKYFRGAFVYTTSGANEFATGVQSLLGDRALTYGAVTLPLGRSSLGIYAWDMRRFSPRNPDTSAIVVPRGNVLAVGVRLDRPLSPKVTLSPLLEFRHELTGPGAKMELLGYLVRTGTDLRFRASEQATFVVQAHLAVGTIQDEGERISLVGPRLGALIEWSR
jgi:hypothetical protein